MITKMKKYTMLVFYREYEVFLEQLRSLGVVHITTKNVDLSEDTTLQKDIAYSEELQSVLTALQPYLISDEPHSTQGDAKALLPQWYEKQETLNNLSQEITITTKEIERMQSWGEFSSENLRKVVESGYTLHFCTCPKNKFEENYGVVINESNNNVYFVAVEGIHTFDTDVCTEQTLNPLSVNELQQRLSILTTQKDDLLHAIKRWANINVSILEDALSVVQQTIDWERVELNTTDLAEGSVKYIEGFCPQENTTALNELLDSTHIYYEASDPQVTDATPIKLKNSFFTRLFEPITRLYSLPNYAEIDPTPFFAPFFMLFFGLCLGDGGYGLLVLLAGLFLVWKKPSMKDWGWLAVFMGVTTMVVGILTGVFFGINLEEVAFLAPIKQYFITETNASVHLAGGTYHPLMVFSIVIGIFQILFAMGFKSVKITLQKGLKYAMYDIAWLVFLVTAIVWLITSPQGSVLYIIYVIFALCALFILFYKDPDKKVLLVNVGSGLYGTYNMVSGLLGDVLSYIRLFALGLAGGILGNVFNSLALQVGDGLPAWIGWLPTICIMLFGHGLNFALCLISSVVHPLRLTFVEFYKNADFEGGGLEYKPFHKIK